MIFLALINTFINESENPYNIDDTVILRPIFNQNDCDILQNDIDSLLKFCQDNNLRLNPTKCKYIRITNKQTIPSNYNISGDKIEQVYQYKIS